MKFSLPHKYIVGFWWIYNLMMASVCGAILFTLPWIDSMDDEKIYLYCQTPMGRLDSAVHSLIAGLILALIPAGFSRLYSWSIKKDIEATAPGRSLRMAKLVWRICAFCTLLGCLMFALGIHPLEFWHSQTHIGL